MEKSSFRPDVLKNPLPQGQSSVPVDEYGGKYKENKVSPSEEWALTQNPIKETPTPWKNTKAVG